MSVTINGTSGLTFNDGSTQNTGATGFGFKNRLINGACMIDQRNAGASVTAPLSNSTFTVDRWNVPCSQASKFTIQQNAGSVTPPTGFNNYVGVTSSSAYSLVSSDYFLLRQAVEGFNVADLGWGTANAATVTLSFWVRSSLTGTFGGSFQNANVSRSYPFSYTISAANTWEQKTITVAGDTSGTWEKTSGNGMYVTFGLGVASNLSGAAGSWTGANYFSATGATSVVGTNGATFYITGVQLEKGSTATSFDYRPYGTELALCQRYYTKFISFGSNFAGIGCGVVEATTGSSIVVKYPVTMRASPTASQSNTALYDGGGVRAVTSLSTNYQGNDALNINITASGGGLTVGRGSTFITSSSNGFFDLSAEL